MCHPVLKLQELNYNRHEINKDNFTLLLIVVAVIFTIQKM